MRKKVNTRWPKEGPAHKLDGKAYELELSRVYCLFELEREAIIYFQKREKLHPVVVDETKLSQSPFCWLLELITSTLNTP